MSFQSEITVKSGRKAHHCDYCGGTIPKGAPSIKSAQIWEGDFYSHRGHVDCVALWKRAFHDHGDPWEGMGIDLAEAIGGDECREIKQECLDAYRGYFPHAICRLELRWQRGDIARRDRYRGLGLEPDPEDCPEVYA